MCRAGRGELMSCANEARLRSAPLGFAEMLYGGLLVFLMDSDSIMSHSSLKEVRTVENLALTR